MNGITHVSGFGIQTGHTPQIGFRLDSLNENPQKIRQKIGEYAQVLYQTDDDIQHKNKKKGFAQLREFLFIQRLYGDKNKG